MLICAGRVSLDVSGVGVVASKRCMVLVISSTWSSNASALFCFVILAFCSCSIGMYMELSSNTNSQLITETQIHGTYSWVIEMWGYMLMSRIIWFQWHTCNWCQRGRITCSILLNTNPLMKLEEKLTDVKILPMVQPLTMQNSLLMVNHIHDSYLWSHSQQPANNQP